MARLLTDPAFEARLAAEVPGGEQAALPAAPADAQGARRDQKIAFGPGRGRCCRRWPGARGCAARRWTRSAGPRCGGWSASCATRTARWCCGWPRGLTAETYATAVAAAEAAELVRGYEDVKLANVARYRARLAELGLSQP